MKLASLDGSLLARKGEARPSIQNAVHSNGNVDKMISSNEILPPQIAEKEPITPIKKPIDSRHFKKSVRLTRNEDLAVRLIAARHGVNQQDVIAQAVVNLIEKETLSHDCICKPEG